MSTGFAWMNRLTAEEKEKAALERLTELRGRTATLKPTWEKYLELYNTHIKPLMGAANEYWESLNEIIVLEHFLQGQAEHRANEPQYPPPPSGQRHWSLPPQVEKLPYADKASVGKKPRKQPALDAAGAKQLMQQLKALDPNIFEELLKKVGRKEVK
jgi:hypothetical protein